MAHHLQQTTMAAERRTLNRSSIEYAHLSGHIRRATWVLALVAIAFAGCFWTAFRMSTRRAEWDVRNRAVVHLALATELAVTTRESAARLALFTNDADAGVRGALAGAQSRAVLDTLVRTAGDDSIALRAVVALRTAIEAWETEFGEWALSPARTARRDDVRAEVLRSEELFGGVRTKVDALVAVENTRYQSHLTSQRHARWATTMVVSVAALMLVAIVVQMRRQVLREIARAADDHHVIEDQNLELREWRDKLEVQTAQLQEQAIELESTVDELRSAHGEQRTLAEEARLLNRRLAEAQQVANLGYWEIDAVTGDVFWSDEMYRLSGLEIGIRPAPTEAYLARVHPEDRERMERVATDAAASLTEFTQQYRLEAPNAKQRTVQAKGRVIVDERGRRKLIGTVQDISDRVELESQLRQAQKMEAVGALAGGVAHDFNNMLTVVDGYGQLLLGAAHDDPTIRGYVSEILGATAQASRLTQQLLSFSRGRVLQPKIIDLSATVRELHPMLERLVGEDLEFSVQATEPLPVLSDQSQVVQVLMNLVVNARDAMPAGGRLSVKTTDLVLDESDATSHRGTHAGPHAVLTVSDTGTGMDEETQRRIFEPFFTTKPEGRGTGLGLPTVFGIVQQSGGSIWVHSELGRGTTFKVFLPLVSDEETTAAAIKPATDGSAARNESTVLVVEDDAGVRRMTHTFLERAGYSVIEAADGVEALETIRERRVDVVVTDTVMPKMGGRELAIHLADEQPRLPVVLTSGYTADALQRQGPLPADLLFIEKPFTLGALDAIVQMALERKHVSTGDN